MIYFLLGQDTLAKDAQIAQLRNKILPSTDALPFDYELLEAGSMSADDLKKALMSLPAIASQRLIIIRESHRLTAHQQRIIKEWAESSTPHAVLVLDSHVWDLNDEFVKKVKEAKIINFPVGKSPGVFDMTRAMERHNEIEALKILNQLFSSGIHPLQIMGGLVWWWSQLRRKMPGGRFEDGLVSLQETDFNIKRSRLKPEYALEMLVVKLCLCLVTT